MPKPLPLIALLVGLALSVYNLSLMTSKTGALAGVSSSFADLQRNYASRRVAPPTPQPAPARVQEEPAPPVVFAVVRYRDGEEATLRANLAEPLAAFYQEMREPSPLAAALVERKNAASKDVNVRLFFKDGSERTFLWPSSNAQDGKWVPPCAGDPAAIAAGLPVCPPRFTARYPDLVAFTR
ncbi:MAG TPA: hypothetical protein VLC10_00160 [Patescibacteria group bacterium]|nr:hypothetical protein [Patescibacteria group bacterium]